MKAIELFPYWDDNRALLAEMVAPLADADLDFRPAPALQTIGDLLRHVVTTEEFWWHGGILGEPYERWRPADWDARTPEEKRVFRAQRFPTVGAILEGLRAAHAPVVEFLRDTDAADLCLKRRAVWGQDNTIRWMLWHLVEHDQHHRAQIATRLRLLGRTPPEIFPRPAVMGRTPAGGWRPGDEEPRNVVPFWKPLHGTLRAAVASVPQADLSFRPRADLPSIHDLILHVFISEDFLIRQQLRGEMDRPWWKIEVTERRAPVTGLAETLGSRFPTVESLVEGLENVHAATVGYIGSLSLEDLPRAYPTPFGPQTLHHVLWYGREHAVHHRGQLFLRMRMAGRTPPDI